MQIGLTWLRAGQLVVCCEHGNEPLGSTKDWTFVDYVAWCYFVKDIKFKIGFSSIQRFLGSAAFTLR
jgi:hypothetical protein